MKAGISASVQMAFNKGKGIAPRADEQLHSSVYGELVPQVDECPGAGSVGPIHVKS